MEAKLVFWNIGGLRFYWENDLEGGISLFGFYF